MIHISYLIIDNHADDSNAAGQTNSTNDKGLRESGKLQEDISTQGPSINSIKHDMNSCRINTDKNINPL